ncbi:MAG: hypothetical protein IKI26_05205 [Prevotella sp.]|nr:hypothetical protein [Prevotella sp.]
MRKIILFLAILLFIGCGVKRENQVRTSSSSEVYTVIVDGHKYVIYDGYYQGGIVHAESCGCKSTSRPR